MPKGWAIFFYGFFTCFVMLLFFAAAGAWVTGGATDMSIVAVILFVGCAVLFILGGNLAEKVK